MRLQRFPASYMRGRVCRSGREEDARNPQRVHNNGQHTRGSNSMFSTRFPRHDARFLRSLLHHLLFRRPFQHAGAPLRFKLLPRQPFYQLTRAVLHSLATTPTPRDNPAIEIYCKVPNPFLRYPQCGRLPYDIPSASCCTVPQKLPSPSVMKSITRCATSFPMAEVLPMWFSNAPRRLLGPHVILKILGEIRLWPDTRDIAREIAASVENNPRRRHDHRF